MTKQEAQNKWWYRLLKVTYWVSAILILVSANTIIFSDGSLKNLDRNKTKIQCNIDYYVNKEPTGHKQVSLEEAGASLYLDINEDFDYKEYYSDSFNEFSIKSILSKCSGVKDVDKIDISFWQAMADVQVDNPSVNSTDGAVEYYNSMIKNSNKDFTLSQKMFDTLKSLTTYHSQQFVITPVYSYNSFLSLFLIENIVILFMFSLIKALFFYIVFNLSFWKGLLWMKS